MKRVPPDARSARPDREEKRARSMPALSKLLQLIEMNGPEDIPEELWIA